MTVKAIRFPPNFKPQSQNNKMRQGAKPQLILVSVFTFDWGIEQIWLQQIRKRHIGFKTYKLGLCPEQDKCEFNFAEESLKSVVVTM